jgi:hypothetical protein
MDEEDTPVFSVESSKSFNDLASPYARDKEYAKRPRRVANLLWGTNLLCVRDFKKSKTFKFVLPLPRHVHYPGVTFLDKYRVFICGIFWQSKEAFVFNLLKD